MSITIAAGLLVVVSMMHAWSAWQLRVTQQSLRRTVAHLLRVIRERPEPENELPPVLRRH